MSTDGATLDRFLGGRVTAAQPASGFRAGHDTVLLAAAVPADSQYRVLELGAGAGIASLCLAARVPGVRITGIEIDPELVRLANENAVLNAVATRVSFLIGDANAASEIFFPPPFTGEVSRSDGGGPFAHIFFNPPFHPDSAHKSPSAARDRATRDEHDAVSTWTGRALALVREGGTVTAIVRADRVRDVQSAAHPYGGIVFPLIPRTGVAPKRVIVRIVKAAGADFATLAGLVLHEVDGRNTEAAEAVLRHAKPLF